MSKTLKCTTMTECLHQQKSCLLYTSSMREAFEQLIERQTCEHFEEWLEQREMAENAA